MKEDGFLMTHTYKREVLAASISLRVSSLWSFLKKTLGIDNLAYPFSMINLGNVEETYGIILFTKTPPHILNSFFSLSQETEWGISF